jgi:hypothetical protein
VTSDLPSRVRQLEDRVQISEQVIKYAIGVDRRDWAMFAGCFTDPVYADFSAGGIPAATLSRTDSNHLPSLGARGPRIFS